MTLPHGTRRLFPTDEAASAAAHPDWVIERVLDEGDSEDVAWLFRTFGRADVDTWVRARGGRRLSLRSRRFWERVLGAAASPCHPLAEALWPY
ncbi:MAG: DUF6922 domain-containing protein [Thermoanaerobaculia bacterium]